MFFPLWKYANKNNISAKDLLALLKAVEERGTIETAHRISQEVGQVFRYAIAIGKAEHNITADLKGGITPAKKHYAYLSERELIDLKKLDIFKIYFNTYLAWKLLIYAFVRIGV